LNALYCIIEGEPDFLPISPSIPPHSPAHLFLFGEKFYSDFFSFFLHFSSFFSFFAFFSVSSSFSTDSDSYRFLFPFFFSFPLSPFRHFFPFLRLVVITFGSYLGASPTTRFILFYFIIPYPSVAPTPKNQAT